jgi:hypothetical protein
MSSLDGFLIGLGLYSLSCTAVVWWVVRAQENSRLIVDIPWPLYAALPPLTATVFTIGAGIAVKRFRRLAFFIGASFSIAFCSCISHPILWRDFIGKF